MNIRHECDGKVIIIEDFLSQDEISKLDSFMRNFDYDGLLEHKFKYWDKRLLNQSVMNDNPGYEDRMAGVMPTLEALLARTKDVLDKSDHEDAWSTAPYNLIKMFPDSSKVRFENDDYLEMFVHIDNQDHMESPIFWGSVFYINDDYEGGEIYYPEYEYQYKPKPGSMVLHEGNTRHGVKRVLSGERYCGASLVSISGRFNENPRPTRTDNPEDPYFYPPGYWGNRMPDDPIQGEVRVPRADGSVAKFNHSPELSRS